MAAPSGYVPGIHAARAVAIVLVLAAHLIGMWEIVETFRWPPWRAYLVGFIDVLRIDDQAGGHVGLLIFFLLSGYIVSQAAENDGPGEFAVKRVARLVPAMAIAVVSTALVAALGRSRGWAPVSGFTAKDTFGPWIVAEAVGLGATLSSVGGLFVLWSINVEYYWYALLGVFIRPAQRWPIATTWAITGVLAVLYEIAPQGGRPRLAQEYLLYVFVVVIGRWIYLLHTGRTSVLSGVAGGVATAAVFAAVQWSSPAGRALFGGGKPRMLSLAWAVLAFCLLLRFVRSGPWKPVAFVADISYGLYLFHIPAMFLVLPVVSPDGRLFPIGLALTLALTVALAWLSLRFVETPARRRARALLGRRAEPVLELSKTPAAEPALDGAKML